MAKTIMDFYVEAISEHARKQRGELLSEQDAKKHHQVTAAAMKHDKEGGEDVSSGSDHHIRATPDEHQRGYYYHGHIGGKKFSVHTSGGYDETQNKGKYSEKKHIQQMKSEVAAGLKAHGIQGKDHKTVAAKIHSHALDYIGSLED